MPDEHWANCEYSGPAYKGDFPCSGCAPVKCRDGSLICDRCFGRMRRALQDAPDLVGRLRSLADPAKAMQVERRSTTRSVEAPAPVPADLVDAAECVMRTLRTWAVYVDPRSGVIGGMPAGAGAAAAYDYAHDCSVVIDGALPAIANHAENAVLLGDALLTVHPADEHGERPYWSVVDAVSRYRLERPDDTRWEPSGEDDELLVAGVSEWGDRLISRSEAARRLRVSESTLKAWVHREILPVVAVTSRPHRVSWFRERDVLAASQQVVMGRPVNLENRSE